MPSDVFLVGVQGSGISMLTQVAHGLRSNGSMDFEDLNEVVPWFHAALLCGQDLDEAQAFKPRLYKTHQLRLDVSCHSMTDYKLSQINLD